MVVGGSQQETLDPGFVILGTRQQGVPVILRELVLPEGFDPVSPSFTKKTTELASVGPVRLPGWGPKDGATRWLETL
ncbi:unnamed protein product [Schistosoma mattheei]|uniref:Uncharacterized protein n=1 Tax=Schistosoma mattheei TaxID=31246 RepID=A0A183P2H7_9TREM|nr:unnamed protein product [Schistosoma mattheei]